MVTIPRAEVDAVTERPADDGLFSDSDVAVLELRTVTARRPADRVGEYERLVEAGMIHDDEDAF